MKLPLRRGKVRKMVKEKTNITHHARLELFHPVPCRVLVYHGPDGLTQIEECKAPLRILRTLKEGGSG